MSLFKNKQAIKQMSHFNHSITSQAKAVRGGDKWMNVVNVSCSAMWVIQHMPNVASLFGESKNKNHLLVQFFAVSQGISVPMHTSNPYLSVNWWLPDL